MNISGEVTTADDLLHVHESWVFTGTIAPHGCSKHLSQARLVGKGNTACSSVGDSRTPHESSSSLLRDTEDRVKRKFRAVGIDEKFKSSSIKLWITWVESHSIKLEPS